jgi:hypothetical protein
MAVNDSFLIYTDVSIYKYVSGDQFDEDHVNYFEVSSIYSKASIMTTVSKVKCRVNKQCK